MFALARLYGSKYGRAKFKDVEKYNRDDVSNVLIGERVFAEDDRQRPCKSGAVHNHYEYLRKQCLRTMPAHEERSLPVSKKKQTSSY